MKITKNILRVVILTTLLSVPCFSQGNGHGNWDDFPGNGNGPDNGTGNPWGNGGTPAAPIDDYLYLLTLVGGIYVFKTINKKSVKVFDKSK